MQIIIVSKYALNWTINYSNKAVVKWVLGELIGRGTLGRVYMAMNLANGEVIAVKQIEISPGTGGTVGAREATFVNALKSNIKTLKELEHPNIVEYLGVNTTSIGAFRESEILSM